MEGILTYLRAPIMDVDPKHEQQQLRESAGNTQNFYGSVRTVIGVVEVLPRWLSIGIVSVVAVGGAGVAWWKFVYDPLAYLKEEERVVVLVAEFEDPKGVDSEDVTDKVLGELQAAIAPYQDDVVVEFFPDEVSARSGGSESARGFGEKYGADIVLWGEYSEIRPNDVAQLRMHVEMLEQPEPVLIGDSRQEVKFATVDRFTVTAQLSDQFTYLTLLVLGLAQYEAEEYEAAIARLEDANEVAESIRAQESVGIESVVGFEVGYFFLGESLLQTIAYEEAIAAYERAIEIEPNYPAALTNQGNTHLLAGDYPAAEPILEAALQVSRLVSGEKHEDVAWSLDRLAALFLFQGLYDKSEPLFLQALEIREELFGARSNKVANSLNNLAELYQGQGRYGEAEPLYLQALEIAYQTSEEQHLDFVTYLNNLANLYQSQKRYEEAESLYLQMLEIAHPTLGEQHPTFAIYLNNLAELYRAQGRYEEAEPLYLQVLEIFRQTLGEQHRSFAIGLKNLALFYQLQNRYEEAEWSYLKALEIERQTLGEQHPDFATNLNILAKFYVDLGAYAKAEPLLVEAELIHLAVLGPDHPDTQNTQLGLQLVRAHLASSSN